MGWSVCVVGEVASDALCTIPVQVQDCQTPLNGAPTRSGLGYVGFHRFYTITRLLQWVR